VGFQTRQPRAVACPADLGIGDTAGLETCATPGVASQLRYGQLAQKKQKTSNQEHWPSLQSPVAA